MYARPFLFGPYNPAIPVALTPGTRLGPYEILSALGAGGMREVYRARDTKLGRDVALKVIPDTFALDPDRLARFQREAQVLASLNHPHIGAIYGFEDSGETHALVLELVEGDTLADRTPTVRFRWRKRSQSRSRSAESSPGIASVYPKILPVDRDHTVSWKEPPHAGVDSGVRRSTNGWRRKTVV
jgi:serine/threonine protein kinase